MHVMFIHPNFPAQFGHIAAHLRLQLGWESTFVTSIDTTHMQLPFNHVNYRLGPGPTPKTFYNPDSLQGLFAHLAAVYNGLRNTPQIRPDLVVGHASYGTMLYLRTLYACPFVGYYELLPPPFWGDGLVLRKEFPPTEVVRLFNATYHTLTYLHLHAVDALYTPTHYQLSTAPAELRHKFRVIFDGVDTEFFQRRPQPRPTEFRGVRIGPETRVVTYVSRGLESARGFDIFMKAAKKIYQQVPEAIFLIAGDERTNYGHELHHLPEKTTFKQWVLAQDSYELDRFHFLGLIPTADLTTMYSLSDLHFYLTVPYVLSWSMMQAMANECVILASDTAPVVEVIDHGVNGLLEGFYDVDGLAARAVAVLRDPEQYRHLGRAARQRVLERYEKKLCIDQLVQLFKDVAQRSRSASVDEAFQSLGGTEAL
jgi:glycosyltransferase involved in cell wall biosynthesis